MPQWHQQELHNYNGAMDLGYVTSVYYLIIFTHILRALRLLLKKELKEEGFFFPRVLNLLYWTPSKMWVDK